MEFGHITRNKSIFLKDTIVLYNSVRKPGYVLRFNNKKGNEYRCCRCRELGKEINDVVVGIKHPEDDHHPDCKPISAAAAAATAMDRNMRAEVRKDNLYT
jgi:hypothetical protein